MLQLFKVIFLKNEGGDGGHTTGYWFVIYFVFYSLSGSQKENEKQRQVKEQKEIVLTKSIQGVGNMSNVALFRDYLEKQNFSMEEGVLEEGGTFFRTEQRSENGASLLAVVLFSLEEDIVSFEVYDIAKINNPLRKEAFHALINELNNGCRFTKFCETDGEISAAYAMPIGRKSDPADLFQLLVTVYKTSEESYPKFMKLAWA